MDRLANVEKGKQPAPQWSEEDMERLIHFLDLAEYGMPDSIELITAETFRSFLEQGIHHLEVGFHKPTDPDTLDQPKFLMEEADRTFSGDHAIQCAVGDFLSFRAVSQAVRGEKNDYADEDYKTIISTLDRFVRAKHITVSLLAADLGRRIGNHNDDPELRDQQEVRFNKLRAGLREVVDELTEHNQELLEWKGEGDIALPNGRTILKGHEFLAGIRDFVDILDADPSELDFDADYYDKVVMPFTDLVFIDVSQHIRELQRMVNEPLEAQTPAAAA